MIRISKILIILISFLLLIASCNKEQDNHIETIDGRWFWIKSIGGLIGCEITPKTCGHTREMVFGKNNKVTLIQDHKKTDILDYSIKEDSSYLYNEKKTILCIYYSYAYPDTTIILPMKYILTLKGNTMELDEDADDGFGHIFIREY